MSLFVTDTSALLDLLDDMAHEVEQLVQQPGLIAQPSLVLGLTPNSYFFWSLDTQVRVTHPNEEYIAPQTQRGPIGIVSLSWLWERPDVYSLP